ncbi:ATP-dependent nuclease [Streptomyces sp. CBMAI 2042]|uniref:ATP-dependent nuclease n=1 Tax=Streptomyces sp. CBMAI 2042 TaxID=2305222 RepID=UPI001F009ED5|nr:ATP-binding protein [Streptomyces sp. CBMAI 2042]
MRISEIVVTDFKAIRHAKLTELDKQPYTLITGRNASGKTALLQALHLITRTRGLEPRPELVRLGKDKAGIELHFTLSDEEFHRVNLHHLSVFGKNAERRDRFRRTAVVDKTGNVSFADSSVVATVFDPVFRASNSFPDITLLGAAENGRVGASAPLSSADVPPSRLAGGPPTAEDLTLRLTTLDYCSLVKARDSGWRDDAYEQLGETFREATGKRLLRPQPISGLGTTLIEVATADGRHPVSELSSGEAGLLGLLCALHQSAHDGSVLLLDEPELHLHPALQMAFLRAVGALAHRTQTMIVTHSVKIVAAAHPSQIYQMVGGESAEQARRVASVSSLAGVVADMGVAEADLLLKGGRLVVEGDRDENYLGRLFPEELENVHVIKAGSSGQVLARHRMLADDLSSLPWVCLIDRDLMSDTQVRNYQRDYPNLHIWPRRALESMLLDPGLVAAVLGSLGRPTSLDEAETLLRAAVDPLADDVVSDMLAGELANRFPMPRADKRDGIRGLKEQYTAAAHAMKARSDAVDAIHREVSERVRERWERDRFLLVDPKKALGALAGELNLFRKTQDLTNALLASAGAGPAIRPRPLEEFRLRLVQTLQGPPPPGVSLPTSMASETKR